MDAAINARNTPLLLLNEDQMRANIALMQTRLDKASVVARPHVKTAKSLPVVAQMVAADANPRLTVSTLREASQVMAAGYKDILYAVGMVPQKLPDLRALANQHGARVSVILDSCEMAQAFVQEQQKHQGHENALPDGSGGIGLDAFIELDVDNHRAGVQPDGEELMAIGQILGASLLRGVMTHAGGAYDCHSLAELETMAERERSGAVRAADVLRRLGLDCPEVSIGSTPTACTARSFSGVSEVRVGVYVFNDLVMSGLGVCQQEDIAISVLATVIGHQRRRNTLLIDAGWMALSSDRGTSGHRVDQGLGLVVATGAAGANAAGVKSDDDLIVAQANQEHGLVVPRSGAALDFRRYPIGSQLRILPVHACATAAQFDGYLVEAQGQPDRFWPRFGGWNV